MFRNIGTNELLLIAGVLMLLFGPKKLPELAKSLSKAGKEFGQGLKGKTKKTDSKGGGENV